LEIFPGFVDKVDNRALLLRGYQSPNPITWIS